MAHARYRIRLRLPRLAATLFILAGLLVAFPATTSAATFEVTNLNDSGTGSLRQAVLDANGAGGADIITFQDGLTGTITLTTGVLALTGEVDIQGPGKDVITVSGNSTSRVFHVEVGATATISGLTITAGSTTQFGGGVYSQGAVTINDSAIAGNTATVLGGGAFSELGTMDINNTIISGNTAPLGAGIFAQIGTTTITNSTISGNIASTLGGGVYNQIGTTNITNSTISGNVAITGGAVYNVTGGVLAITNSTITNNTGTTAGGISNAATLTLEATIVAANPTTVGGPDLIGTATDGGYNLIGDGTGSAGLLNGVNGNIVGTFATPVSPMLDILALNGGPTPTHAVLDGSPVLNHIPAVDCAVSEDQRGVTRPQEGLCEIGAFEVQSEFFFQACLYAGSLSQVQDIGEGPAGPVNCGRGSQVILIAGSDQTEGDLHACLYAGSLTQVGTEAPANCGRGTAVVLAAGQDLWACLYAGRLSQVGYSQPSSCGRGELVGFATSNPL